MCGIRYTTTSYFIVFHRTNAPGQITFAGFGDLMISLHTPSHHNPFFSFFALNLVRFITTILLLLPALAFAQGTWKLDSLELRMKNAAHDTTRIQILIKLSNYYDTIDYARAATYARESRDLAMSRGLTKSVAFADAVMARIFVDMGNYKQASSHFFNALKYYEEAHDTVGTIRICNNLGTLHDRLKEYDKALAYYTRGMNLLTQSKPGRYKSTLATLYNNIANIHQTKNEIASAQQFYEKSLALAIEANDKNLQGTAYNNLGKLLFTDLKNYKLARDYLLKGLAVREALGDKGSVAKSYNILAAYYMSQTDFVAARSAAERALKLGEETSSLDIQMWACTTLSKIEEETGNHADALMYFKMVKDLNDKIQVQLASSEVTRLQMQHDFEKAEKIREDEQQRTRLKYIAIIVALAVGLIIAILIVMIVRNKARQTELKRKNLLQDVEIKNKELTTNVIYLMRKNELINNVAERLLKLVDKPKADNQKGVHEIILELQKEADADSWTEFEMRFEQVHNEFYKNLRRLYPDLSPAEEKLCAFLRLNMSSKEIAAILQQSIKSVEVARTRLRKKLNLTNTSENLVTYLSTL